CRSCFQARPLPCARHASPIGAKPFDSLTLISRPCCIDPLMLFANPNIGTLVFARARDIRLEVPDVNGKDRDVGEMLRLCAYKFVASAFRQAMSPPTQCGHIFPPHPRTLLDAAGMSQTGPSTEVEAWAIAMGGGWSPGAPKRSRKAGRMPL